MYRLKTQIPDLRANFKDLAPRSQTQFRSELLTVVKPQLQSETSAAFGVEPGPVRRPFLFSTPKSRRAFFASKGFGRGLGKPRDHQLSTSWFVEVGYQIRETIISVKNLKAYAKFVYPGPKQVPGHVFTGWGAGFDSKIRQLEGRARVLVAEAWRRSISAAIRGRS